MAERVTKDSFEAQVLKADGVVLADFYSDSCVPCKRMAPILEELEKDRGDEIKIVKIDVNCDGELAAEYGVRAVPTVIFFRNGGEVSRTVGLTPKSEIAASIDEIK